MNLHAALRESCDVYFYHARPEARHRAIARDARLSASALATGIDLQGEKTGLVPDDAWSLATRKHPWYPGETISVSIGQGPLLMTPLQMAVLIGGDRQRRRTASRRTWFATARCPAPQRLAAIDPDALAHRARRPVGGGQRAGAPARWPSCPGVEIAGKTGTVQVIAQRTWTDNATLPFEHRDHAWFASFAPAGAGETPEVVIVVFVEHGGGGSRAAAPVAKAIYETYFREHLDHPRPL